MQYDFLILNDTPPLKIYKNHMAVKNLVVTEYSLDESDCIIFQVLISQKLSEVESLHAWYAWHAWSAHSTLK